MMKKFSLLLLLIGVLMACTDNEKNATILSIEPNTARYNDLVTITTTNFDTNAQNLTVTFGGIPAEIVSVTESTIVVKVPLDSKSGKVSVASGGKIAESAADFTVLTGQWKALTVYAPNEGTGRQQYTRVLKMGNKIFIALGSFAPIPGVTEPSSYWQFNPDTYEWTSKNFYGTWVWLNDAVSWGSEGNKGYILEKTGNLRTYDADNNTWSVLGNAAPTGHTGVALVEGFNIGNNAFVLLGDNALMQYNAQNNTWTEKASFPGDVADGTVQGLLMGPKAYIITDTSLWEYDPTANTWQRKADPLTKGTTFVAGSNIYRGMFGESATRIYVYRPTGNTWSEDATFVGNDGYFDPIAFNAGNRGFVGLGVSQGQGPGFFLSKMMFELTPND